MIAECPRSAPGPYAFLPNYTWAMFDGHEPAGIGHALEGGGHAARWDCRYGNGETDGERVLHASFSVGERKNIFICGDMLHIVDVPVYGSPKVLELCANGSGLPGPPCISERNIHHLPPEKAERYLQSSFPHCRLWDMVQRRALSLYESFLQSHVWKDRHGRWFPDWRNPIS